jgi:hypothetical protein
MDIGQVIEPKILKSYLTSLSLFILKYPYIRQEKYEKLFLQNSKKSPTPDF